MALLSGFFNAITDTNGVRDRLYDARDMSSLFDGIILDGVFQSVGQGMLIKAASGGITVSTGRAWFNHTWTYIDAALPVALQPAHTILNRIDAVVLEVNHTPNVRANSIKIIQGAAASSPKRPTMLKSELVNQYPLAYVYRKEGTNAVSQGDITNTIGTSECPFVIGVNKALTADQLLAQWTAQWEQMKKDEKARMDQWMMTSEATFNVWFGDLQDQIEGNDAAAIAAKFAEHNLRIETLENLKPNLIHLMNFAVESPQRKRKIFVQLTEPAGAVEGDIWFKA